MLILDVIRPAAQWPSNIRRLFLTRGIQHFDRVLIVTFARVNGLVEETFVE